MFSENVLFMNNLSYNKKSFVMYWSADIDPHLVSNFWPAFTSTSTSASLKCIKGSILGTSKIFIHNFKIFGCLERLQLNYLNLKKSLDLRQQDKSCGSKSKRAFVWRHTCIAGVCNFPRQCKVFRSI